MTARPCQCPEELARPRARRVGRAVCERCDGEIVAQKKSEEASESAILTPEQVAAEVKQIRRIIHGLNNRLEKLDDALNSN